MGEFISYRGSADWNSARKDAVVPNLDVTSDGVTYNYFGGMPFEAALRDGIPIPLQISYDDIGFARSGQPVSDSDLRSQLVTALQSQHADLFRQLQEQMNLYLTGNRPNVLKLARDFFEATGGYHPRKSISIELLQDSTIPVCYVDYILPDERQITVKSRLGKQTKNLHDLAEKVQSQDPRHLLLRVGECELIGGSPKKMFYWGFYRADLDSGLWIGHGDVRTIEKPTVDELLLIQTGLQAFRVGGYQNCFIPKVYGLNQPQTYYYIQDSRYLSCIEGTNMQYGLIDALSLIGNEMSHGKGGIPQPDTTCVTAPNVSFYATLQKGDSGEGYRFEVSGIPEVTADRGLNSAINLTNFSNTI